MRIVTFVDVFPWTPSRRTAPIAVKVGRGACAVLKVTINPLVVADPREYLLDAISRAYLKF